MNHDFLALLITQTWQVTLLALAVAILTRYGAKQRPHLAHALWILVLLKCLTPPVFSSPISAFSWLGREGRPQTLPSDPPASARPATVSPDVSILPIVVRAVPVSDDHSAKRTHRAEVRETSPTVNEPMAGGVPGQLAHWVTWIWIGGAVCGLSVTLLRLTRFLLWIRRCRRISVPEVDQTLLRLQQQLRLRRRVRVMVLENPVGPAVLGLLRPVILLPAAMVRGRSAGELEPLMAHELIHVRRGDLWWALIQTLARHLFWFHPLVQWAAQMVTRESERSCDEETVACLGCPPRTYARSLLEVLEQKHRLRVAPALPGVRPVDITSARLERVMNLGNGIHRRTPFWVWLVLLTGSLLVLPGAALVLAQERLPVLTNPAQTASPLPNEGSAPLVDPGTQSTGHAPYHVKIYAIGDLVDRFCEFRNGDPASARELLDYLGCRYPTEAAKSSTPQGQEIQLATAQGMVTLGRQHPTMRMVSNQLYAFGTDQIHDQLARSLQRYRSFGFQSVVVETRLVTLSREQWKRLNVDWSLAPHSPGQRVFGDPGVTGPLSLPSDPATTPDPANPSLIANHWIATRDSISQADTNGPTATGNVVATSFVEQNVPVLYTTLDPDQLQEVIAQVHADSASGLLQAPTIAALNGQDAVVHSGSERPFVVGMEKVPHDSGQTFTLQPVVRVIAEGTLLKLSPRILDNGSVNLRCRLERSEVLSVEPVEVPIPNSQTEPSIIQVPEVATSRIESSLNVPAGKTLLISHLQRNKHGDIESFLVFLTCRVPDSGKADSLPAMPSSTPADELLKKDGSQDQAQLPTEVRLQPGHLLGVAIEGVLGHIPGSTCPTTPKQEEGIGLPILIQANGSIALPLIDELPIQGLTIEQAANRIRQAYLAIATAELRVAVTLLATADAGPTVSDRSATSNELRYILTGKQLVYRDDDRSILAPVLTPVDSVDVRQLQVAPPKTQLHLKASGTLKSGDGHTRLIEHLAALGFETHLAGDITVELTDSLPTLQGDDLEIRIDRENLRIRGSQGCIQFLNSQELVAQFRDAEFTTLDCQLQADELRYQHSADTTGLSLQGSAELRVKQGDHWQELTADRIQIDPSNRVILQGSARLLQAGPDPIDIQSEHIEIDMETAAIKSSAAAPARWSVDRLLDSGELAYPRLR